MTRSPAWWGLGVTLAIQSMVSMALLTLPVMAPEAARALGASPGLLGVYVALAYLGAMGASLAAGAATARYGAIRISQIGLLLCGLGLLLSAVPVLPVMGLGAWLIGLGYGPITPASSHLLARSTPPAQMALVFSIKQTGVPLGGLVAGALVPMTALWLGWQGALLSVAGLCLLCALGAQGLRTEFDADRQRQLPLAMGDLLSPVRLVLGQRALSLLALCSFFFSIIQLSLTTYLVTYLHETQAYSLVTAGLALSVAQAAGVVGRIAWGWVADRFLGARRTLITLAGLMVLGCVSVACLQPSMGWWLVGPALWVFGSSAIGWNGVYLSEVARQAPPGQASVATGGTLAITFLGVVLGPALFGAIASASGSFRLGYALLAVPALVCAGVLWARPATPRPT
ncbi:MFS transporter [Curvibacter sp. HBC61]|uniref:MFS transporter n=1 Tax=Curvibacter cyanobacteriorum TaxID=3026422 RepID=A0ABT5N2S1_9BURK|nr:MFS transporter [Curvibacter sp. HBC61]MDD0839874.1 MFS transporter [Curvibacter sp. HBC61]